MSRVLRPLVRPDTYRALLFQIAELCLGTLGIALLIAGWVITLCLAITPLVVPLLIGLRAGVGLLAQAEATVARRLIGVNTNPPVETPAAGFWDRGFKIVKDPAFWKQQAHLLLAWPIALVQWCLFSFAVQLIATPVYYRWVDSADVFGRRVDTLPEALGAMLVGLALLMVGMHLVGPITRLSRRLVSRLLTGDPGAPRSAAELRILRLVVLRIHAAVSGGIALVLVGIWAVTTRGYFWPVWPLLSLALVLAIHTWVVLVLEEPRVRGYTAGSRALAAHIGISAAIWFFLVADWAASTRDYFWPIWPLLGLGLAVVAHAALVLGIRGHRIEELETSRAGAVNVQESELRRIERDLHDGAQARLVALGMSLGLAEQKFETDPEAVRELLAEARHGATEALEELRDLARGIHPPILTDRGLEAAIAALVAHSPVPVTLSVDVPERPDAAVETAAYFVVSEALANAIKYADATHVDIRVRRSGRGLSVEVADDGGGGADPTGNGLTGMRQRVEALDGRLRVASPEGGPTTVTAELP